MKKLAIGVAWLAVMAPLSARAGAQAVPDTVPVAVLTATVESGSIITKADIGTADATASQARNALSADAIIGKEARRRLKAGKPVRDYDVREPQVIRKGEGVSIVVMKGGLTIAATGRALSGGPMDATIRVQNLDTHAMLEGEVIAPGVVRIRSAAPDLKSLSLAR